MDIKTQERYAAVMQKLIKETQNALEIEIAEYADDCISNKEAEETVLDAFITSGEEIGVINHGLPNADMKDFFEWLISEIFYDHPIRANNDFVNYRLPREHSKEYSNKTKITNRQEEICRKPIDGKSNKQIAYELGICETTLKKHLNNAFNATGTYNRVGLVMAYLRTKGMLKL